MIIFGNDKEWWVGKCDKCSTVVMVDKEDLDSNKIFKTGTGTFSSLQDCPICHVEEVIFFRPCKV